MNYNTYYDKVLGGWIGKCAGGILGAPIEGFKRFNSIPYSDDLFATNFANDDLDLQVLWLDMLLKKGSQVREADFKAHWLEHVDFPWCEYGVAYRNMRVGLDNPDTGKHNNRYWQSGMGSPIRSEIWGMVNPGAPQKAAFYAGMDSRLDHTGFSVTAEQYLSACASLAFFEDDMRVILREGLRYIPSDSDCAKLVGQVMAWNNTYDFDVVSGKIKSFYGDADFTNAPMNVAFILLALLHANRSFDFLMDALHLGHDSDCVVATAGSLLGIILGYDAIPKVWKERVGDELLVSPEISGIHCPKTLSELSELTCKAGIHFSQSHGGTAINGYPKTFIFEIPSKKYALHTEVMGYPNPDTQEKAVFKVHYENLTEIGQQVKLAISSSYLEGTDAEGKVAPFSKHAWEVSMEFNQVSFPGNLNKIPYHIGVNLDGKEMDRYEKGFPYYGKWLLLGPFLEDDPSLVPLNEKYPDHGLPSLPSCDYMNHDLAKPTKEFITTAKVQELMEQGSVFDQAFHATLVHPKSMTLDLKKYFKGSGERTLYLYTEIESEKAAKKWLALGSANYITVWHNGNQVYRNDTLKRRWPLAHTTELDILTGKNTLLIRLDVILDDFAFEIGLKEHNDKHPHQTQWETELQFNLIQENE